MTARTERTNPANEKAARCARSGCAAYGKRLKACQRCAGPVVWRDDQGHRHGMARACHHCANNGLGLPVCWSACPGPNDEFQTDGQKMVTLGALDDPDGFLQEERARHDTATDFSGEAVIDAIPGEPEDPRRAYDDAVTEHLSHEAETACRIVLSAILSNDETDLRIFYWLYNGHKPVAVAERIAISKQAVFKRMRRMSARSGWMRAFIKSLHLTTSSGGGSNRGRRGKANLVQDDLFAECVMRSLIDAGGATADAKRRLSAQK